MGSIDVSIKAVNMKYIKLRMQRLEQCFKKAQGIKQDLELLAP